MKVSVFGNPDIVEDNLAVKLVPGLRKKFPKIEFLVEDPSEGLKPPKDGVWVILDVAKGIDEVKVFSDLSKLETDRKTSLHDYDVATEIKLLRKIGKVEIVRIIAIPIGMKNEKALREIVNNLKKIRGYEPRI